MDANSCKVVALATKKVVKMNKTIYVAIAWQSQMHHLSCIGVAYLMIYQMHATSFNGSLVFKYG
jgi:hypothetical protein